jgi:hypothetical protein
MWFSLSTHFLNAHAFLVFLEEMPAWLRHLSLDLPEEGGTAPLQHSGDGQQNPSAVI